MFGSHPELVRAITEEACDGIVAQAVGSLIVIEEVKGLLIGVVFGQASARSYPQTVPMIGERGYWDAIEGWLFLKFLSERIKDIQAIFCRDPELSFWSGGKCVDSVMTNGVHVYGVSHEGLKGAGMRVETIQPAIIGAHPKGSLPVFKDACDVAVAEAIGLIRRMIKAREILAIKQVERIVGPKPHKPIAVLKDGVNRGLGEALL